MKTKTLVTLSVVLLGTACAASAGSWSVSIGVGLPVYYPPAPVIVAPAPCPPPPPVVYCPPPLVVYAPPVVCAPTVRFVPPGHAKRYYGHWKHDGHRGDYRYGRDSRGCR